MEPEGRLRQSPASGLPPYTEERPGQARCERESEYVALNPDINKATPPRLGAARVFSDPFNVSEDLAPPVGSELLSPSHVFTSQDRPESEPDSASSVAEDNCSSVCSVDSGELEMVDDELPDPSSTTSSPAVCICCGHPSDLLLVRLVSEGCLIVSEGCLRHGRPRGRGRPRVPRVRQQWTIGRKCPPP